MCVLRWFPRLLVVLLATLWSCTDRKADTVVNRAIDVHGGSRFSSLVLEFDFRGTHYTAARDGGIFRYSRTFSDSTGLIRDVLDNDGFTRYRNDQPVELTEQRKAALIRSVNSVIYFALLPFGLNDDPVNREWVGETTIRNQPYDVVRVTFDRMEGNAHRDNFLYWFHRDRGSMDYLAYQYESDGGGIRFREAVNPREVGGLLIQDYINYRPENETVSLDTLEAMFKSGALKKVSEIRLENVTVRDYKEG